MSYCTKCGSYIPIGETECPSCGFDPEARRREPEQSSQYRVIYQQAQAERTAAAAAQQKAPEPERAEEYNVRDFLQRLEALYNRGGLSDSFTGMMLGTGFSKVQKVVNLIQSYPIPTAKRELFDFLYLGNSNINTNVMIDLNYKNTPQRAIVEAWILRTEQMLHKAEALYGSEAELLRIRAAYERKINSIKYETEKKDRRKKRIWWAVAWIFLFPFYPVLVTIQASHNEKLSPGRKAVRIAIAWATYILFFALPYISP